MGKRVFRIIRWTTYTLALVTLVLAFHKAAPPLVVTETQLDEFVAAIRAVMELTHTSATFWSEALGLARRAAKI